jgi:LysM repeat protein
VSAPATGDTYVVRRGDNLSRIARRFGTTAAALARLNGIANPSLIYAGQVLRLSGSAPAPSGGGKRVVIDLSEQHLYAYEGNRLVYSFVASTGVAPTYTRTGEFRVQSKIPKAYGSAWNIWMPHWLGIYWAGSVENGVHALPILPNGQRLWAGYLGRPVSYGCVVLGTDEAQRLYNWAEIFRVSETLRDCLAWRRCDSTSPMAFERASHGGYLRDSKRFFRFPAVSFP